LIAWVRAGTEVVDMFIPQPLRPFVLCLGAALLLAASVAVVLSAATPVDRDAPPTPPLATQCAPDSGLPSPRPSLTPPSPAGPDETAMRAILEIRREQGGLLDGTLLDELSRTGTGDPKEAADGGRWQDEEFARALRGVATSASHAAEASLPEPAVPANSASAGATAHSDLPPRCGTASPNSAVDEPALVNALRGAARQLEQQANHLEDCQQYADADRLRALSHRIRRESRRWVPPTWSSPKQPAGVTPAPPPAPAF
jgi:hypothetical protein